MFVDREDALAAACQNASEHSFCALDVEFIRRSTYEPIVALIQLATGGSDPVLIDALEFDSPQCLADLLRNDCCVKVIHSCSQDLEALDIYCNALPASCFDTQIAAAMCGMGYQVSFGNLVENCLGKTIDKRPQTSDWKKRPLSARQIAYAETDVTDLLECFHILAERLNAVGRFEWVVAECADLIKDFCDDQWKQRLNPARVRGSGRMNPREFTILANLVEWRENLAKRRNRPAQWMLSNAAMIEVAIKAPRDKQQLKEIEKLTPKQQKYYEADIIDCVARAQALPKDQLLTPPRNKPPTKKEKKLIRAIADRIRSVCDELSIAPEIVATQRDISKLVRKRDYDNSPVLNGWRGQIVGDSVLAILEPGG